MAFQDALLSAANASAVTGLIALDILLPAVKVIGPVTIQTGVEQVHIDRLTKTRQPVESGADITDHAYMEPARVEMRCGWSNSSVSAIARIGSTYFDSGSLPALDYISDIYGQLLALQQRRTPFTIFTGLRTYDSMLLETLTLRRDPQFNQAIMVEIACEEIIIVSTQNTTLAPQSSQAIPQQTSQVVMNGQTSPLIAIAPPSIGGVFTPID